MKRPDLAEVYDDHVWDVYGFFAYRLGSKAEAEDLTQQTFERAVKAWKRFDPDRSSPKTWLLAIANNLLIDHYRSDRSSRHVPFDDAPQSEAEPPQPGPEEFSLGLDAELAAAIENLTEQDRHVIALRFGGDLTGPEIAEVLDLSVANVHQILSRALRKLRAQIEETRTH